MAKATIVIEDTLDGDIDVECEFFPQVTEESKSHAQAMAMKMLASITNEVKSVAIDDIDLESTIGMNN